LEDELSKLNVTQKQTVEQTGEKTSDTLLVETPKVQLE